MQKGMCWIVAAILSSTAIPIHALDLSPLVGTVQVQFQPVQSQGVTEGCTLVYRVIGQDHAYRKGSLVSLAGNIAIWSNKQRSNIVLALKIGIIDSLDPRAPSTLPFFAYLQTPHGSTAKSMLAQNDSEPGFRLFIYELNGDAVNVYADILHGEPVMIGFNRKKDGLDVLVPLDLHIVDTSVSRDGSTVRRQSVEMLVNFSACASGVIKQVQRQMELQQEWRNAEPRQRPGVPKKREGGKTTPPRRNDPDQTA
jgi:hypothetical protein